MPGSTTWTDLLRRARRERGLTQTELARRASLSLATIKSYETAARHPSKAALAAIVDALGLPGHEAVTLLVAAGYASPEPRDRIQSLTLNELVQDLQACTWPAFITNQSFDVIAANGPFARVFGVNPQVENRGFGERSLLAGLSDDRYAGRLVNWEEVACFMIGLAKADPRFSSHDERMLPWLEPGIHRLFGGDPARLRRFLDLWEDAPPIRHRLRHRYRLVWRSFEGPVLDFSCTMAIVDLVTEGGWNEWHPADEPTWRWLTQS